MMNEAHISLSGFVATQPYLTETRTGIPTLSMRVAWTPRKLDRVTGEWVDADTSFLSVQCYRKLAENAATCLRKGDPVVVRGRVTIRDFEDKAGRQRTRVEVDAASLGHDLSRGVAQFQRLRPQTGMTAMEYRAAQEGAPGSGMPGSGVPGVDDAADEAAFASLVAGAGEPAGRADGEAGAPGSGTDMFDEDAVGELAEQASVTAPF
jgi:single-strand DNA-binding protein